MKSRTQMFRLNGVKMNFSLSKTRFKDVIGSIFIFDRFFYLHTLQEM